MATPRRGVHADREGRPLHRWSGEPAALAESVERAAPTTDVRQRFCVSVVEPPPSVKQDPEYDPSQWLVVREGPGAKFKVITKMGSVGHFEADAVDGDWTHVVDPEIQGWVSSKYVQECSATRP